MAVTNNGNRIILAAANDEVTGPMLIQMAILDHSAAATCVLQDSASKQIAAFRTTTTMLTKEIYFIPPIPVTGVKASTLSGGAVTIVTA